MTFWVIGNCQLCMSIEVSANSMRGLNIGLCSEYSWYHLMVGKLFSLMINLFEIWLSIFIDLARFF